MVQLSVILVSDLVEGFRDKLFFTPVDGPIVFFSLGVFPLEHDGRNAICEVGFKLDVGSR